MYFFISYSPITQSSFTNIPLILLMMLPRFNLFELVLLLFLCFLGTLLAASAMIVFHSIFGAILLHPLALDGSMEFLWVFPHSGATPVLGHNTGGTRTRFSTTALIS